MCEIDKIKRKKEKEGMTCRWREKQIHRRQSETGTNREKDRGL